MGGDVSVNYEAHVVTINLKMILCRLYPFVYMSVCVCNVFKKDDGVMYVYKEK